MLIEAALLPRELVISSFVISCYYVSGSATLTATATVASFQIFTFIHVRGGIICRIQRAAVASSRHRHTVAPVCMNCICLIVCHGVFKTLINVFNLKYFPKKFISCHNMYFNTFVTRGKQR